MLEIYTNPKVDRMHLIRDKSRDNGFGKCVWFSPVIHFSWEIAYGALAHFLYKNRTAKQIALFLPETGLGYQGIQDIALNYVTNDFTKDKNIYVATDSSYLFDWIRVCIYLGLINNKDVTVFHETKLNVDDRGRISGWPEDMFPVEWPSEILLSETSEEANEYLFDLKERQGKSKYGKLTL